MRTILSLVVCWILVPVPAWAGAGFSGTFVNAEGERVVLEQAGSRVTGSLLTGGIRVPVQGTVRSGVFHGQTTMPGGEVLRFSARISGGGLAVEVDGEVEFFRRVGGSPAKGPSGQTTASAKVARLRQAGPKAGGKAYVAKYEGWRFNLPRGWTYAEREGAVLLGSKREAGLILVDAEAITDPAALHSGLSELLAKTGARFAAPPPFGKARLPGGKAVFTEVQGTAQDGTSVRVRAVGVIGKRGTVAILGMTVPGTKFENLRKRVDAIARSVRFVKPRTSPGRKFVVGEWFSYSGSSTMSGGGGTTRWMAFCPDGRFYYKSESSYSGGAGTDAAWGAVGGGGDHGRWTCIGNARQGTVHVTNPDGSTADIKYQAKRGSDGVYFDGNLYGRTGKHEFCR